MARIIKQVLQYISDQKKKEKQMYCVKNLKQEVNIGANGTQKYVIKKGINKGKVLWWRLLLH